MRSAGVSLVLVLVLLGPCSRGSVQAASQVQQQSALLGDGTRFKTSSRRLLSAADVQRAAATLEPDTVVAADAGSAPAPTSAGAASAKLRALNKRSKSSSGTAKALWRQSGQHVGAAAAAAAAKRGPTGATTDWIAGLQLTASQVTGPAAVIAAPSAGSVLSASTADGVSVVFDASRSQAEAGGSISSYRWAITGPGDRQRVLVAQGPTASLVLPPGSAYTARLTVTSTAGQSSSDTVAFAVVTAAAAAGGEAAAGSATSTPAAPVQQPPLPAVPGAADIVPSPAVTPTDTAAAVASVPTPAAAVQQPVPVGVEPGTAAASPQSAAAPATAATVQQPVPVAVEPSTASPLPAPAAVPVPAPAATVQQPSGPVAVDPGLSAPLTQPAAPLPASAAPIAPTPVPSAVAPAPLAPPPPPPPPLPVPLPPLAGLAPTPLEPRADNKFCNPAGDYDITHNAADWDDMSLCCKDAQRANVVVAACSTLPPRPVLM